MSREGSDGLNTSLGKRKRDERHAWDDKYSTTGAYDQGNRGDDFRDAKIQRTYHTTHASRASRERDRERRREDGDHARVEEKIREQERTWRERLDREERERQEREERKRREEEKEKERQREKAGERQSCDDAEGHFVVVLGSNLTPRYKILAQMGEGTFGKVVEAWDRKREKRVAIKIIRNVPKYRSAAKIEIRILRDLEAGEALVGKPSGCITLRNWFDFRNHICMTFPKLGLSLYDFLKMNNYRPFLFEHVRAIAQQLISSVAYMHNLKLIHTDLKPENILLVSEETLPTRDATGRVRSYRIPASSEIKLIDFGSATYDDEYHSHIVSTRHYRAPEIILGLGWTFPCDIWSIGCILLELYTGEAVFQTHENAEHLAMMERLLGRLPKEMGRAADKHTIKFFSSEGLLLWPESATNTASAKRAEKVKRLDEMFPDQQQQSLCDLVRLMLVYDPARRITARDALQHDFFRV